MVCGVSFDTDIDCSHHPHEPHPVPAKPGQCRFNVYDDCRDRHRHLSPVFALCPLSWTRRITKEFLAVDGCDRCRLRDVDPQRENLVYETLRSRLMRSLLNALQDGRLIELPDTDKW